MIKKNSNTLRSWTKSKCETKEKIIIDISFYFWSVWFFNHTHGYFFGIGASTKRSLELGNL